MQKLKLILYYIFISKLPHSRYGMIFNTIRCWYVCNVLKIMQEHKNNYFEPNIYIGNGKNIQIGKYCHINEDCFLQGVTIGNHVLLAPNVAVVNSGHEYSDKITPIIMQGDTPQSNPIIQNNVWIGRNVIIMPNITIEEGSIVGAGAVVTKNVKTFTVVGGVPAKFIKERN